MNAPEDLKLSPDDWAIVHEVTARGFHLDPGALDHLRAEHYSYEEIEGLVSDLSDEPMSEGFDGVAINDFGRRVEQLADSLIRILLAIEDDYLRAQPRRHGRSKRASRRTRRQR